MNVKSVISGGCQAFSQKNNSPKESEDVKQALLQVSKEAGVDPRFPLAIMLQESLGCVRVDTTSYSVSNPGLFQSHNGNGTCYNVDPCPDSEIVQMVRDGVMGTLSQPSGGPGLEQLLKQEDTPNCKGAEKYYRGARAYNSGSVVANGNLGEGVATHCYCSDVANRLLGWDTGTTGCTLDG